MKKCKEYESESFVNIADVFGGQNGLQPPLTVSHCPIVPFTTSHLQLSCLILTLLSFGQVFGGQKWRQRSGQKIDWGFIPNRPETIESVLRIQAGQCGET